MGYERTDVPLPGLVGGPCLEKDPHIFAESAEEKGATLLITKASRSTNEQQPYEVVSWIFDELRRRKVELASARVAVLGLAFKGVPATDDLRGSMALKVIDALTSEIKEHKIKLFDPVISASQLSLHIPGLNYSSSIESAVAECELL